uniref:KH-type splicing regulatory protein n=1 Tax=Salarias fasciatus TaxID=181472 RepID=A0A672HCK6_SALFA
MSDYGALPSNGVGAGMKKDAFADAVQRARQIAAKIGGDGVPSMNNNGGAESYPFTAQKRSLEEADEPDAKKLASQSERETASCMSIEAQLAALSQQSVRPSTMTEECRVPDAMVGLIIGRGGEQINKIQQDSGCKVQIAHDSAGLPERSVSLTGSPDAIQRAKALIDDIVSRGHDSPNGQSGSMQEMIIPAGKAGLIIGKGGETIKQLQERAGVKMILIQDGSQPPNVDKPLRIIGDPYKVQQAKEMVNEILRERDHAGFGDRNEYGSRMGGGGGGGGGGIEIAVPRHSVGVVIGRNGEMIKKIQNDAGVKIQFKPDDGTGPEKIAHIMGPPDQCQHAASIITDLLQSIRAREEGGQGGPPGGGMPPGGRGRGRGQGSWGPPGDEVTFSIPAHKCGLVIGRGGENVKAINQQTGAFVEISRQPPPNGDPNFKLFTIRGSPQQIDHAKQLIEEKIEGPLCPVGGGPGPGAPGGPMGPYNPNPYNPGPPGGAPHQGGPGGPQYCPQGWGSSYQQWQAPSPHDPNKGAGDPNAAWAAYYAQYYGQQPGGAMGGQAPGPAAAGDQGPQAQTAGGQPDYTKAWEEYYKKIAAAAPGAGAAAAPAAGGAAAGGQQDYSAAWAEYYRQQAAYYGQGGQAPGQAAAPQQGQQVSREHPLPQHTVIC